MAARRYQFVTFVKWWQIKLLSKTEITSFTWAVVGRTGLNDIWNRVVDVAVHVFENPDMFAEFCGVLVFCVAEWCNEISVSCLEVVFCESFLVFCRSRFSVCFHEWVITKQACRDESVVFFLFSICTTFYLSVFSTVIRKNRNTDFLWKSP